MERLTERICEDLFLLYNIKLHRKIDRDFLKLNNRRELVSDYAGLNRVIYDFIFVYLISLLFALKNENKVMRELKKN